MSKDEINTKVQQGVIFIRPQSCFIKVCSDKKEERYRIMKRTHDPKKISHGWAKWDDMTYKTNEECLEGCQRIVSTYRELDVDIEIDMTIETPETEKPVVAKTATEKPVKEKKEPKPKYDKVKIIAGLMKKLEAVQKKADSISTDIHGNYTNKRAREAANRQKEKERQEQWARTLQTIINKWEDDTLPEELKTIRSVADLEVISFRRFPDPPADDDRDWYKEEYPTLLKKFNSLGITSYEQQKDISLILDQYGALNRSPEEERKINISNKIKEFRGMKIPGFFPTPDGLIDIMIDRAELDNGMTILEPSAGLGNIPDRIVARGYDCNINCCERQNSLVEILGLKGYKVPAYDFFDLNPFPYDRIIMNPPFEKGQDVEHVTRAFNQYLKEEGILVSIMSSGVRSNLQQKFVDFRELVEANGEFYDVEAGAFKDSFNPTGVNVCMVVLRK